MVCRPARHLAQQIDRQVGGEREREREWERERERGREGERESGRVGESYEGHSAEEYTPLAAATGKTMKQPMSFTQQRAFTLSVYREKDFSAFPPEGAGRFSMQRCGTICGFHRQKWP